MGFGPVVQIGIPGEAAAVLQGQAPIGMGVKTGLRVEVGVELTKVGAVLIGAAVGTDDGAEAAALGIAKAGEDEGIEPQLVAQPVAFAVRTEGPFEEEVVGVADELPEGAPFFKAATGGIPGELVVPPVVGQFGMVVAEVADLLDFVAVAAGLDVVEDLEQGFAADEVAPIGAE